tara:strand:+ start:318 stop:908 length:591 start_codon:yes stop_codon:yes gene_type:complete
MEQVNTVRLAKVISFSQESSGAPHVEVQPAITNNRGEKLPIIVRVPVVYPMSSSKQMGVAYPLAAGDYVVLLFNQESLDEWLSNGGEQEPYDVRSFDLSDAMAVPGIVPLNNDFVDLSDSHYVRVGDISSSGNNARLELTDKVRLGNNTVDLVSVLYQLLAALETTFTVTSLGSQPLSSAATIGGLKTTLAAIKAE